MRLDRRRSSARLTELNRYNQEDLMRWLKTSLFVVTAMLTAGIVSGQTTTGTITGRVIDSQDLSIPGVTISIEGPSLQGITTVVSTENGDYIIPQLPPGTYKVTFQLTGFERQEKTVSIAPTQTLPLNVTMGPAALSETVSVIGKTTDVLTQTAQVATNFKQSFIEALPTNRTIDAVMLRAPAVHPTGPSGNFSIAGAMSFESLFMVNGVSVSETVRGQPFALGVEDAIQETTVSTGGISAEYGRFSGGVVNVITKSGGNLFTATFRDSLYNDNWRSYVTGNTNFAPLAAGQLTPACNTVTGPAGTQIGDPHCFAGDGATAGTGGTPTKTDQIVPQYEYTFGGPIMKDKIWFFTSGRIINQTRTATTNAPTLISYGIENPNKRYEGKITYSANSDHRFTGNYIKVLNTDVNNAFGSILDLASLYTRKTPQDILTLNYNGILSPSFFVEGRVSSRHFSFEGSGAPCTDIICGTLLQDRQRGSLRYWSPTFCGICDPEKRDNDEEYIKGTYFKPTKGSGSHTMSFGYDLYNDKRFSNNHQSGSDYRINGTTVIPRDGVIYPQWLPGTSTILQYNPILQSSAGTKFRTHSLFYNDNWRYNQRLTFNLGLRWDKNHGVDAAGNLVVKDSALSPRLGVVWDPKGDGAWSISGSFGRYVSAISNPIADGSSVGGQPATFQWAYQGPAINPDPTAATLVGSAAAIQQVFDWCNRDSQGFCRNQPFALASVPGVSLKIGDNLMSPNVVEAAGGISRQLGAKAVIRADYSFRNYRDFYAAQIDTTTGVVTDQFGNRGDLEIDQNTNLYKRRYSGVTFSTTYHATSRTDIGGNYTVSRLWGNVDGENVGSGPVTNGLLAYPEYHQDSWFVPQGDLATDQRHRFSGWLNYGVPKVEGLTVALLQDLASGIPYGALGTVDARPYVAANIASQYATPQGVPAETYFYTARDAFRTEWSRRTDLAVNYGYGIKAGSRRVEAYIQAQILNLFNQQDLCACGGTVASPPPFTNGGSAALLNIGTGVLSPANSTAMRPFDPFNVVPVQGTNWNYNNNFGTPLNRFAFTTPRTFRVNFGVRF
jgi:hypothetical protein